MHGLEKKSLKDMLDATILRDSGWEGDLEVWILEYFEKSYICRHSNSIIYSLTKPANNKKKHEKYAHFAKICQLLVLF